MKFRKIIFRKIALKYYSSDFSGRNKDQVLCKIKVKAEWFKIKHWDEIWTFEESRIFRGSRDQRNLSFSDKFALLIPEAAPIRWARRDYEHSQKTKNACSNNLPEIKIKKISFLSEPGFGLRTYKKRRSHRKILIGFHTSRLFLTTGRVTTYKVLSIF